MIKPGTYNPYNTLTSQLRSTGVNTSWINNTSTQNSSTGARSIGSTPSVSQTFKPSGHFTPRSAMERDAIRGNRDQSSTNFDIVSWAPAAADFAGKAYNSFLYERGVDDLLMDAGYTNSQVNGISYQRQNDITGEMSNVRKENVNNVLSTAASGAALGSAAGPLGAAVGFLGGTAIGGIGSLIRSSKAKKEIDAANYIANNTNRVNQNVAISQGMQMDFYKQYGNSESQVLYAKDGVDYYNRTKQNKMGLTQSKNGFMFAPVNAYTSGGEQIVNTDQQYADTVKGDDKDNKPTYLEEGDTVLTKHYGIAQAAQGAVNGVMEANAKLSAIGSMLQSQKTDKSKNVAYNVAKAAINSIKQERSMYNEELKGYRRAQIALRDANLLPQETQHADGGIDFKKMRNSNLLTSILGAATGVGQFLQAHSSRIKRPNTYASNPYESRAIRDMYSIRTNTKPIMDAIDRESAAGRYRTSTAGGLGAGQRLLANTANIYNTQAAKSDALMKAGIQDSTYVAQAAQLAGNLGAQTAQRIQNANQFDLDYYSKAHAARQQGEQIGVYNMLNSIQQYFANASKLGMFNNMYNLYASTLTDDQRKVLAQFNKRV